MSDTAPRTFVVESSPHFADNNSVNRIMWTVVAALLPAWLISIYNFGLEAVLPVLYCVASAILSEVLWQTIAKRPVSIKDGSAVLTGLLLAYNVPPGAPWWLCAIGGFFAIIVAKQVFGGLGCNPFNPALAARVFLLVSFPVQMTRWIVPDVFNKAKLLYGQGVVHAADAVTAASPLGILKEQGTDALSKVNMDAVYSGVYMVGSLGEMSDIAIILGGLFLLWRRIITWHIPAAFIATVAVFAFITNLVAPGQYAGPLFHLGAGGLMLGAWFMATDYVTSPMHPMGKLVFGVGCGLLTMVIRLWGGYPEGVSFAILLMNSIAPLIDRYTHPVTYGGQARGIMKLLSFNRVKGA